MKIAILADVHLNKANYNQIKDKEYSNLPFRTADFMRAFEFIVDKSIELNPNYFVIMGDVFDNHHPSNDVSGFFNKQLYKLNNAKITSILMVGNHDVCQKHHALTPLKELNLDLIKVIDSPTLIESEKYCLMFFPYSLDIEQNKVTTKTQFFDFIEKTKTNLKENKEILFFGHFGVQGAIINQYAEKPIGLTTEQSIKRIAKNNIRNRDDQSINILDLDEIGASYVFLGDFHKHQILPTKNCKAMYAGSIEKSDISEIGQKKGFLFFNDAEQENEKLGKCKFIEYPNSRSFLELRGDWNDIKNAARSITNEHLNAIVKISFIGNKNQLIECQSQLPKLKDFLSKKISPVHIVYEQELIDDKNSQEANDIESILLNNNEINADDILNVVTEIIDEMEKENNENLALKKIAKEIYNEIIGNK